MLSLIPRLNFYYLPIAVKLRCVTYVYTFDLRKMYVPLLIFHHKIGIRRMNAILIVFKTNLGIRQEVFTTQFFFADFLHSVE